MLSNLINVVAKVYAGLMVIACLVFQVLGYDIEYTGVTAIIGMVVGFGAIMIGELAIEVRGICRKAKFMKLKEKEITEKIEKIEGEVVKEAAH